MRTAILVSTHGRERRATLLSIAGALLVVAGCTDQIAPSAPASVRPSVHTQRSVTGQASDLVATPDGWYHRSCVHTIPNGATIALDGRRVTLRDGSSYQIPSCGQPGRVSIAEKGATGPNLNSWLEYAYYDPGTSWGTLNAGTHVPTAPTAAFDSSQVYYTFPGIQSASYIVQPVLTYGYAPDYGGNSWTAASWRCNSGSDCNHGTAISVASGDSVVGTVSASACSNGQCTWTITTLDVTSGVRSYYSAVDTSAYVDAVGGSVETYNLTTCHQLPADGMLYSAIGLYDQSNNQVTPSWTPVVQGDLSPSCGFGVDTTATSIQLLDDAGPSVTLSGPKSDTAYAYVTVTANASGGVTPYSYAWTVNGDANVCGDESACEAQLGAAYTATTFDVTVTDANEVTASGQLTVAACPSGSSPIKRAAASSAEPLNLCGP